MNMAIAAPQEITSILNMKKGDRLVYHVGHLAYDRGPDRLGDRNETQNAVRETGNIAWKLMEQGKVALCQRRIATNLYEYIAERR